MRTKLAAVVSYHRKIAESLYFRIFCFLLQVIESENACKVLMANIIVVNHDKNKLDSDFKMFWCYLEEIIQLCSQ